MADAPEVDRQQSGLRAEILYRWRVAPEAEPEFFREARRQLARIAGIEPSGRFRPRLLQPAIGPTPLLWELRIELELRDLGDLLYQLSIGDDDELEPLPRLSRLPGAEPLGDMTAFFRMWKPPEER
jgi:hypothetical protein